MDDLKATVSNTFNVHDHTHTQIINSAHAFEKKNVCVCFMGMGTACICCAVAK